jgi:hypothetical protein
MSAALYKTPALSGRATRRSEGIVPCLNDRMRLLVAYLRAATVARSHIATSFCARGQRIGGF